LLLCTRPLLLRARSLLLCTHTHTHTHMHTHMHMHMHMHMHARTHTNTHTHAKQAMFLRDVAPELQAAVALRASKLMQSYPSVASTEAQLGYWYAGTNEAAMQCAHKCLCCLRHVAVVRCCFIFVYFNLGPLRVSGRFGTRAPWSMLTLDGGHRSQTNCWCEHAHCWCF